MEKIFWNIVQDPETNELELWIIDPKDKTTPIWYKTINEIANILYAEYEQLTFK